jgi:hypothetical protein
MNGQQNVKKGIHPVVLYVTDGKRKFPSGTTILLYFF